MEVWNFQKAKHIVKVKFGYGGFLDFVHEAKHVSETRARYVTFLKLALVDTLSAVAIDTLLVGSVWQEL